NMEMEPDIENMTMSEYLEYEAAKERRLWDDDEDLEDNQEEDGDDRDTFEMWDITIGDVERISNYGVDAHGVVLGSFFATGRHFKFGLVRYHAKDDDGIFVIMDAARRSRLGTWLRACCLFIIPSKFRGVFCSNSTLILNFHFINVQ
ncbi:hypothetical protein Tco_1243307, partial [Tanacetum coccineum]